MSLLHQLGQRGVLRVAAWYAAAAWVLIQVASTVFPQFDLPVWTVRAVIVVALLGFPLALLAAWTFDFTAAGIRRTDSTEVAAAPRVAPWRVPSLWIALAAGVLLAVGAQQAWQRLVKPALGERPSIAVLPFTNLSPDPENAYFADGLHEEVLATLARVSGLRVISRTSVLGYRDTTHNLREIARTLDVSLILEGSVRRAGDQVRLTLQLIDARSDEHLWSQTYDRTLDDVLRLQETVALQIVSELGAQLAPGEQKRIAVAASSVPQAYDRYLHALALYGENSEQPQAALALLDEATALDPRFAHAYALRARIKSWSYSLDPSFQTTEVRDGARSDFERALMLQPELPEALVARGVYYTYVVDDPEGAAQDLERALSLAPNDAAAHSMAAFTLRRLGRHDEALLHFERAFDLSPGQVEYGIQLNITLTGYGRYEEAERVIDKLLARHPGLTGPRLYRYFVKFQATGETRGWREEFERLSEATDGGLQTPYNTTLMLIALGDFAGLIAFIDRVPAESWIGPEDRAYLLPLAHVAAGAPDRARPYLEALIERARKGDDAYDLIHAGVALELLGRSAEALRAADAALPLLKQHDARNNPRIRLKRAWVLIHSGKRAEEGYEELKRQLGQFELQPRWVAVSLPWVLLRDNARVQEIIREALPK